ncbi:MAG: CDP-archaeol synthase [Gammaproteobacteria bacterium]|jgi:CDP-2,3-bis-(O-geranylgeranyl)-sn-glycerol synthase
MLILKLLILVTVANGTPVIIKKLLGQHLELALDGGLNFFDGRRLFGPSKTVRGVVSAILATTLCAMLMELEWYIGTVIGSASIAGDLFSSFIKRRLNMPPSSMALGLDQVPESLLPLVVVQSLLPLTVMDIAAVVVIFSIGQLVLSRILYKLNIRDRPY